MSKKLAIIALVLLSARRLSANEYSHASLSAYPNATISAKDKATGITAYVESDGRHLALISNDGRLLEIIEVVKKGMTCIGTPVIRYVAFKKDKLSVIFCKHDFGEVDLHLFQYKYLGAD